MILGAVETKQIRGHSLFVQMLMEKEPDFDRWVEHPTSCILHHHRPCCDQARLWFLAYARSMEIWTLAQFKVKAPTWLSKIFTWGPSPWPISWCEVMTAPTIDCGVFAALAREVFSAQGQVAYAAQGILSYNETCTQHWKDLWQEGCILEDGKKIEDSFPWIGTELVYHELCVLEMPGHQARVFDSTFGMWHESHQRLGFGSLLALRTECPRLLNWGNKTISYGEWVHL